MISLPFLLFHGMTYYANGGWHDFVGAYATVEEAQVALPEEEDYTWWEIVDVRTLQVVMQAGMRY